MYVNWEKLSRRAGNQVKLRALKGNPAVQRETQGRFPELFSDEATQPPCVTADELKQLQVTHRVRGGSGLMALGAMLSAEEEAKRDCRWAAAKRNIPTFVYYIADRDRGICQTPDDMEEAPEDLRASVEQHGWESLEVGTAVSAHCYGMVVVALSDLSDRVRILRLALSEHITS